MKYLVLLIGSNHCTFSGWNDDLRLLLKNIQNLEHITPGSLFSTMIASSSFVAFYFLNHRRLASEGLG